MSTVQIIQALQPMIVVAFILAVIYAIRLFFMHNKYAKSSYGKVSGNSFFKVAFDKGNYGEFLTFAFLEKLPGDNKLLTNIYLPKEDGTTTEIDLLMLNGTGIYVFESKNYSGWIFGDEKSKNWTQTLKGGKKNKFLNPVWQNNGHIKALQKILNEVSTSNFYSYIVFSERCELKKVSVNVDNVAVVKRNMLYTLLKKDIESRPMVIEAQHVDSLFESLEKYSLVDDDTKLKHIQTIKRKTENS